jgi:hypothetical protein
LDDALRLLLTAFCLLPPASAQGLAAQSPSQAASPLPSRIDPKAQQLLDRTIQGLGGAAFLDFKSQTSSGRIYAITDEATAGLDVFESSVVYPDKRRFSYGKKKPVTLVNNGDRAWELDRLGVTRQLPEQLRRWKLSVRYGLENLLRVHIHDPGILIQDGGVDFVDNVPTHVVDIIETGGGQAKLYLNKQTLLPVRIDYQSRNPHTNEWDDFSDVYSDYQNIQGIQTPMHLARFLNGERVSEVFRHTVRYDEEYPADYFEPAG